MLGFKKRLSAITNASIVFTHVFFSFGGMSWFPLAARSELDWKVEATGARGLGGLVRASPKIWGPISMWHFTLSSDQRCMSHRSSVCSAFSTQCRRSPPRPEAERRLVGLLGGGGAAGVTAGWQHEVTSKMI